MNPSQIRKSSLAVAIALVTSTAAVAQEVPRTQATLMNQVTVTATRTERQLDEVASSVSVVSAEETEKNMARNIRDMVKYEPGVEVTSDSRFGLGSFNIRGMDENRVKITVDGMDQAKAFGYKKFIQSQRNFFDIENMKAVEIVKGPASTLHGSDAIGGVVAFQTKDPADYLNVEGDDTYASVKGGYSSADSSFSETLTVANRSGDWESMVVYTHRDGSEQESYGGKAGIGSSREEADPLNYSSDSVLGKLQYQVNDDHRIGITTEWLDSSSDTNMYSADTVSEKNRADDKAERVRVGLFHEWEADKAAFDSLKWCLDWQNSESRQKTWDKGMSKENRLKDYSYKEKNIQFDITLNKELVQGNTNHFFTYGASYENKEQESLNNTHNLDNGTVETERYAPIASVQQYGIFFQDEIGLMNDRLIVTPGIRYDSFENKVESTEFYPGPEVTDKSYDSLTSRIGGVFKINDTWSTFAQFSQGFSTPGMFDMYFNYENPFAKVIANPELKPEENDSIEFGIRADSNIGSMEVTAFYNDYKNFIAQVCIENCNKMKKTFQHKNMSEATIKGIELKSLIWLDEAIGTPAGTRLNTAIAWSEGTGTRTNDFTGEVFEDEPLNTIAPLTAVIGLGYDSPTELWGSELSWTLVAAKDSDDISNMDAGSDPDENTKPGDEQFATSGFGLVDLTAYYKPTEDITINAGVFNIADKKYWMWNDVRGLTTDESGLDRYTQPGRNYSISMKWEI